MKTSVLSALLGALAVALVAVGGATARTEATGGQLAVQAKVRTVLTPGQEVPKPTGNVARARATFTATVTKTGTSGRVVWKLTFSRLTGPAVASHIHVGARGKAGRVAVAICGPCRNGMSGRATARSSALKALQAGRAYVNVHTARNPGGEVRGQIAPVQLGTSTGGGGGGGGGDPTPPPPPDEPPYP